jgi:hypothetical protein
MKSKKKSDKIAFSLHPTKVYLFTIDKEKETCQKNFWFCQSSHLSPWDLLPSLSLVERVVSPPGQEDHQTLIPPVVIRPIMVMAVPLTVMVTPPRSRTTTNRQANPVSRPKSRNLNQNPLPIRGFRNISEADIFGMIRLTTISPTNTAFVSRRTAQHHFHVFACCSK